MCPHPLMAEQWGLLSLAQRPAQPSLPSLSPSLPSLSPSLLPGAIPLGTLWLVAQLVKNPAAVQEPQVQSLGGEDPLEKEVATHCSALAWRIPWTEEPGGLQSMGSRESDTT